MWVLCIVWIQDGLGNKGFNLISAIQDVSQPCAVRTQTRISKVRRWIDESLMQTGIAYSGNWPPIPHNSLLLISQTDSFYSYRTMSTSFSQKKRCIVSWKPLNSVRSFQVSYSMLSTKWMMNFIFLIYIIMQFFSLVILCPPAIKKVIV